MLSVLKKVLIVLVVVIGVLAVVIAFQPGEFQECRTYFAVAVVSRARFG